MCTLVAFHRCVPGAPLWIAANRDEYHARPAEGPALRSGPGGLVLAPLDRRAGGTWIGLSSRGLLAAVTNRPCADPDPERRSRGRLVLDALAAPSAAAAAERLEALPQRAYNPFNLLVADRHSAATITYLDRPRRLDLAPGVHVLGNADPLAPPTPKLARLRALAETAAAADPEALRDALAGLCRSHAEGADPLGGACVHTPAYGTRSSTLLRLSETGRDDAFFFADGPPCRTGYGDFSPLLHALDGGVLRDEGDRSMRKVS
jgi:uncharacterized protein with NRDE domain